MKKTLLIILLGALLVLACDTENNTPGPFENRFVKFYGGEGDHEGVDLLSFDDGSIILLGNADLEGASLGQQIYVVKVDATGNIIWEKKFGISGDDIAKDMELTSDNRIVIAGETQKGVNDHDVFVKIITTDGVPVDSIRVALKTIDNQESDEEVYSVSIVQDGFIVSGATTAVRTSKDENPNDLRDAMHLKFSNSLVMVDPASGLWSNTTGLNDSDDVLVKMIQVSPTSYYGFGYTNTIRNTSRDYKYWVFSLGSTGSPNAYGTEILDKIGSVNRDEFLSHVIESPAQSAEGFVLSGISKSPSGATQCLVVKLQKELFKPLAPPAQGFEDNVLAEEYPLDLGNEVEGVTYLTQSNNGGFFLLANSKVNVNEASNISLVKLSNNLLKERETVYFGGVGDDFSGSAKELPDGRLLIVGTMTLGGVSGQIGQKKMVLLKMNNQGKFID